MRASMKKVPTTGMIAHARGELPPAQWHDVGGRHLILDHRGSAATLGAAAIPDPGGLSTGLRSVASDAPSRVTAPIFL